MICPKCGFEQPDALDCARCGVVIAKYRGPVFQAAAPPLPPPPPAPPSPPVPSVPQVPGEVLPPLPSAPEPLAATLREEPPAAVVGTLYQGPPAGMPSAAPAGGPRRTSSALPFDTGSLISETFSIYFSNFLPFLLLTSTAFAPIFALVFLSAAAGASAEVMGLVSNLGSMLCTPLATAALTFGVVQQMRRRETSVADCLRVGLGSLVPVLFVALLQGLAVGAGLVFCVVPGFVVIAMLAVAVPAAVEERPGVFAALSRSQQLTDGYRWSVFGVLFVLGLLTFGLGLLAIPLMGGAKAVEAASQNASPAGIVISQLLEIVPSGLSATASAVMYYRLRSLKEGIDVEEIASVFD